MNTPSEFARHRDVFPPDRGEVYRTIGGFDLRLHLFLPHGPPCRTAVVFFHGGGWRNGPAAQFFPQCCHLAERGVLGVSAEYRLRDPHAASPFEGLADAKRAIRWVRRHAERLSVAPERIVAGGGSAGGHLAAAMAMLPLEETDADTGLSCIPDALILCNPVVDTTQTGYGAAFIGPRCRELSPAHHVRPGVPPALVVHGDADTTVPIENARRFADLMRHAGNRCDLHVYPGLGHGFFNYGRTPGVYASVLQQMTTFLESLGLLGTRP
jgi:acetyl esterase/lipase